MALNNRYASQRASAKMAFCGLITAISAMLMLAGGLIPIATYCIPMGAGLLLLPVLLEFGRKTAWTTFAATALLSILLGADKEAAFFYLFIGYYPLLKWEFDKVKNKVLRLIVKLTLFNASIVTLYLFLALVMNMGSILAEFSEMGIIFSLLLLVLYNICMLLYDRLLFPMVFLYVQRVKPRMKFLKR